MLGCQEGVTQVKIIMQPAVEGKRLTDWAGAVDRPAARLRPRNLRDEPDLQVLQRLVVIEVEFVCEEAPASDVIE